MVKRTDKPRTVQPAASSAPSCGAEHACGACQQLGVPYKTQLAEKTKRIRELAAASGFDPAIVQPILGMDEPYRYRNKVISPFVPGRKLPAKSSAKQKNTQRRDILCGMYAAGTHRVVDTSGCLIENEQAKRVIRSIRSIMLKHGMEPYDEDRGTGFVRHAIVRTGHESGEVLVTLVTNGREFPSSRAFCRELRARCPFVTMVTSTSPVSWPTRTTTWRTKPVPASSS